MRAHLGTEGLLPKVGAREEQHGLESVELARDGWHGQRLSGHEGRAHLMRAAIIGHEGRTHEASLVMREAISDEGSNHWYRGKNAQGLSGDEGSNHWY